VSDSYDPTKKSQTQTIQAINPSGRSIRMRVKAICWYRRTKKQRKVRRYAVQLLYKIKDGDWEGSLEHYINGARRDQITHFLFIVREGRKITHAALVPIGALVRIWCRQRDISDNLIKRGKLGRRKKNHAKNGSSPTLWLQDDEAQEVVDALWNHRGVQDLVSTRIVGDGLTSKSIVDDTFDDLPGLDPSLVGSDGAPRVPTVRSMVKRNKRVRREVMRRANGRCERSDCNVKRSYLGFFDVHHILGAEKSDRIYNCVALCPNCHREAHYAPNQEGINSELLDFAMKFKRKQLGV
jgi:5-methylcytosine-specific restriction protein A